MGVGTKAHEIPGFLQVNSAVCQAHVKVTILSYEALSLCSAWRYF